MIAPRASGNGPSRDPVQEERTMPEAGWTNTPHWDYSRIFNGPVKDGIRTSVYVPHDLHVLIGRLVLESRGIIESQSAFIRTACQHYAHHFSEMIAADLKLKHDLARLEAQIIAQYIEDDFNKALAVVAHFSRLIEEATRAKSKSRLNLALSTAERILEAGTLDDLPELRQALDAAITDGLRDIDRL